MTTPALPTKLLPTDPLVKSMTLRKAGANWVEGPDRFFDRETEIEALAERVRDGTHTLLTAQRRMGKTSLVRELLRRLRAEGGFETVFVDVEDAADAPDAVAAIGAEAKSASGAYRRIGNLFSNALQGVGETIDELSVADVRVKLRAGVDAGSWRRRGDGVFAALADADRPVVLAIDELPILVHRLLAGGTEQDQMAGRAAADGFLSWLRRNGQTHRDRVTMILSGSVGLEPILRRAGLAAHANIYAPFALESWDERTASGCIGALAETYRLELAADVRADMCRRLRRLIPHHVQLFFDHLHEHLRRSGRRMATREDVEHVYTRDMLSVRGQADLDHYETRLRLVLGTADYRTALALLTEAAVADGVLADDVVARYRERAAAAPAAVDDVLRLLEHDGYLEPLPDGSYRFVSGLLEDWWRARHGRYFVPLAREGRERRSP